jgi:iron(III) transport system ATP-binding protein
MIREHVGPPRLRLGGVHHAYGPLRVLDAVDLEVAPAEIVCLLGASGCGKTTLLRIIAGLERLQAGRILLDGRVIAEPGAQLLPEERGIGFLFQDFALFPHLTVLENAMFGLGAIADRRERREVAETALLRVGLRDHLGAYPHQLSGGQQQRAALARALAPSPMIMLLDEPFSSLDARLRGQVRDETLHVLKSTGVATVMVTHDPEEAMFMGDRIALMDRGRILQSGTAADLYYRPQNPFVAGFFGEVNRLPGVVRDGRVATPFGEIGAGWYDEGQEVDVIFRPEAVLVQADAPGLVARHDLAGPGPHLAARILACRLLPGATVIHMRADGLVDGPPVHLHARVPGAVELDEGSQVRIRVQPVQMHVFARDGAR